MNAESEKPEVRASRRALATIATLFVLLIAGAISLFAFVWGRSLFDDLTRQPGGWLAAIGLFLVGAVAHEIVHLACWLFFDRTAAIEFRRSRRKIGFVATPAKPMPLVAYRAGLAMPALFLGALPMAVGMTSGNGLATAWGALFLFESYSDLAILAATLGVPAGSRVTEASGSAGVVVH